MADKITYYAIIAPGKDCSAAAGVVRRCETEEGFHDEALWSDLKWHFSPTIVEWERAESTADLTKISEEEASLLIDRLRERWSTLG